MVWNIGSFLVYSLLILVTAESLGSVNGKGCSKEGVVQISSFARSKAGNNFGSFLKWKADSQGNPYSLSFTGLRTDNNTKFVLNTIFTVHSCRVLTLTSIRLYGNKSYVVVPQGKRLVLIKDIRQDYRFVERPVTIGRKKTERSLFMSTFATQSNNKFVTVQASTGNVFIKRRRGCELSTWLRKDKIGEFNKKCHD